jgi:hypothetical protein
VDRSQADARDRVRRGALALKRRERARCLVGERKRCHGELANRGIGQGTTVKTERLSYRAFQRTFGKSSKVRGAGLFVSTLARKLEEAGGQLIEFGTRNTCLSQFDHVDGTSTKKPRSQRFHQFSDGSALVGICIPPSSRPLSTTIVLMRAKSARLGQVRKHFCERHQTDLNL